MIIKSLKELASDAEKAIFDIHAAVLNRKGANAGVDMIDAVVLVSPYLARALYLSTTHLIKTLDALRPPPRFIEVRLHTGHAVTINVNQIVSLRGAGPEGKETYVKIQDFNETLHVNVPYTSLRDMVMRIGGVQ